MEIKGFIKSSLLEWEGRLSSVLFLPGCNLRCRYCHAARLVFHSEELDSVPPDDVLGHLCTNQGWLDGVVITGGEPTLHFPELLDLIRPIRKLGLDVMIETNGTRPDVVAELIQDGWADALSMDVKAPLTHEDYARVTGVDVDVEAVRRSIGLIMESGLEHEFRISLVPGLIGRDEVERILPVLEGARQIALQNFRPRECLDPALCVVAPFQPEEMDFFEELARPHCGRVVVRGRQHALAAAPR